MGRLAQTTGEEASTRLAELCARPLMKARVELYYEQQVKGLAALAQRQC
jgi:hypothetical protein